MILHVACLPFPSHQGTQAAIAAMLRASAYSGRPTHLLAYSHRAYEPEVPFEVHRIPDFPKLRSLRSGPSWGKIALDASCIVQTRRLAQRLRPQAIVAHHIEAALAALAARVGPVYYVAHTFLRRELPVYFPLLPERLVGTAAEPLERLVCARSAGVAAVAPSLARLLGRNARYVPVPWPGQARADRPSRQEARVALGLPPHAPVCLYAGNLDRYQGWELLLQATADLRRTHPGASLLIATESDPGPLWLEARRAGVADSVYLCRLDGERARKQAHAASDLAWIPRRTEGGLPIKMLDALARKLPVVAMERAAAGLAVRQACVVVRDDDPGALAAAARRLLEDEGAALAIGEEGFRYLAAHHSPAAFTAAMDALLAAREASERATPAARPQRAVLALRAR
jgi:glycosyltransferase involved in cell wall biosynthesis